MSVPKTVSLLQRSHGRSWRETLLESSGNRVRVATGNGLAEDIRGSLPAEMGRDRRAMQYVFGPARGELPEGAIRLLPQQHGVTLADENSPVSFQFFEVNGASAAPVCFEGRINGVVWEDDLARYCQVGDLYPMDLAARPGVQCRQLYEVFERVLEAHGFVFTDCIRTWLYPSNVLDWYDTLNEVRTRFYEERGVFDRIVPASTGIGAGNTRGAAIVGSLLAVKPKGPGLTLHRHSSPLQCSAEDYGSSFSRAVEVRHPEFRELYVSGTASIEPGGLTIHVGDIERQIQLSLDVMEAILKKQQFSWADVSRSIAYFKHKNEHLPVFQKIARERALPDFSMVCFQADICRPDLLFEIEADAIAVS
ncbi:Rid family hydrolase [Terrimicrobium sacchariphilum]|nr:Rid family hydrolase [Terrimicrobium sacchariphilum]